MIDINADLGEGTGNDAQIMPLIHSRNIACGGHFGDAQSMEQAMLLATRHQVKIAVITNEILINSTRTNKLRSMIL